MRKLIIAIGAILFFSGCSLLPDIAQEPRLHNPFPQLHRVAVLPFFNQSAEPTVDGELVAKLYYTELQQIPGLEVLPVGVVRQYLAQCRFDPSNACDFQKLAQALNVDAVVAGSITEYTPYYPPRMGLAVRWYAANPSFHEIPPGYGLPWGTPEEEYIPDDLVFEAEFALAKEQLKTQTPNCEPLGASAPSETGQKELLLSSSESPVVPLEAVPAQPNPLSSPSLSPTLSQLAGSTSQDSSLPANWPDPRGFIPPPPSPERPPCIPHQGPVMSHVRLYDGHDSDVTEALASYYYFRDDARFGGWQAYLQRSDDFVRFCCYMHISEMLTARGGAGKTRVVWRWPIGRYER